MLKRFLIFFIFIAICSVLYGNEIRIREISSEDGLSDDFVLSILQDSYGFVWIGTYNGLNRFDGTNLVTFSYNPEDTNSISNNFIQVIFEDSNRNLWIGTGGGGLCRYDRRKQLFQQYRHNIKMQGSIISNSVFSLGEDSEKRLWIATENGICYKEYGQERFHKIDIGININSIESMISCMYIDSKDNVWFGTRADGLIKINNKNKKTERYKYQDTDSTSISGNMIRSIAEDSKGNIWIATYTGGLNMYEQNTNTFQRISDVWNDTYGFTLDNILNIFVDRSDALWLGTNYGGIYRYSYDKDSTPQEHYKNEFIEFADIKEIAHDSEGNVWVGTAGKGAFYFNPKGTNIDLFNREKKPEIKHNDITSLLEGDDGKIWFGTDGGGLQFFDRQNSTFGSLDYLLGNDARFVVDLDKDTLGNIWISTWGGGVIVYSTITQKVKKYQHKKYDVASLSSNNLKGLFFDAQNNWVWVATYGLGLNIIDLNTDTVYSSLNNTIVDFNLSEPRWGHDVFRDQNNILWILTANGIYSYDYRGLIHYHQDQQNDFKIVCNYITDFFEDTNGDIYFSSREGLCVYNHQKNYFENKNANMQLNTEITNILKDKRGNVWVSIRNGIVKCNLEKQQNIYFDELDGLQGKNFSNGASIVTSQGEFIFGGANGFNIFRPDSLKRSPGFPALYITAFELFFNEQIPNKSGSVLNENIMLSKKIKIPYHKSVITISYSAIKFDFPEKIQYKYRLLGFSDVWNEVENEQRATFTNLYPGKYVFQVKSTNADGIWNENSTQLEIQILPPWYMSLWLRLGIIFIVTAGVFSIFWYRIFKEKKEKKKLDTVVKMRTSELISANEELQKQKQKEVEFSNEIMKLTEHVLDQNQVLEEQKNKLEDLNRTKNKFFSIIGHDLKNPLNGLIGFSELLSNNYNDFGDEERIRYLNHINQSSVLLYDLLVNLLNWSRTQSGSISFTPIEITVASLIESNIQIVKTSSEKKGIQLHAKCQDGLKIYADVNMVNTILRNLLQNAIKFTPSSGKITLSTYADHDSVIINIEDTGIGMTQEQINDLFKIDKYNSTLGTENEMGTGLGLIICSEFVKINNGKILVESKKGKGSKFILTFPTGQNSTT